MRKPVVAGPLIVLLLWCGLHYSGLVRPLWLPSPWKTFLAIAHLLGSAEGVKNVLWTLGRVIAGVTISTVIGVPIGLLMGRFKSIHLSLSGLVDFFRSLPALAMFPLLMIVFGIGEASKIATTVLSCSLVLVVHTIYGVQSAAMERLISAELMSATRREIFTKVVLWEALPSIATGMRIALSLAVVVVVVTEMFVGTNAGLGYRIYQDQLTYRIPQMYAAILITGMLGLGLNVGFIRLERCVIHWTQRT